MLLKSVISLETEFYRSIRVKVNVENVATNYVTHAKSYYYAHKTRMVSMFDEG